MGVRARGWRYDFEIDPVHHDYGHVIKVDAVEDPAGQIGIVHPNNPFVAAPLRRSLRAMSRLWSLDQHSDHLDAIVAAIENGGETESVMTAEDKFSPLSEATRLAAFELVTKSNGGAEFEDLVARVLESASQQALTDVAIERRGGPNELGADLIVFGLDPVGIPYRVVVQIKLHEGSEADHHALEQIARAHRELEVELQAGLVITTAEGVTPEI